MLSRKNSFTVELELIENQYQLKECSFLQLKLAGKSLLTVRNPGGQQTDHGSGGGVIQVEVPTDPTDPTPPSGGQAGSALGLLSNKQILAQALPLIQVRKHRNGKNYILIDVPIQME